MNRTAPAWLVALLVAACAGNARLNVDQVLERNADARGGLERWRAVSSVRWVGHVEGPQSPVASMKFQLDQKRPNKTHLEIDAPADRSLRVFNGQMGWKLHWVHGQPETVVYSPIEVLAARTARGIDGPLLDLARYGITATLDGLDEAEGRKAWHLSLKLSGGGKEEVWVDAESFLEIRQDRLFESPGAPPRRVTVRFADYHTIDGLKFPFVIETASKAGKSPDKMLLDKIELNPPLDDSVFENPAAPRIYRSLPGMPQPGDVAAPIREQTR